MILRKWDDLPDNMKQPEVRPYYDILSNRKASLFLKFAFDRILALFLLVIFSPIFLVLAVWIKLDSSGEVFFRQERVTRYGKKFRIFKFRTMVKNAEACGSQVTTNGDMRVTKVGRKIRACRLDEIPQLINILKGEMSFVGTRPEVPRYVAHYTSEMRATLLIPAGVTSEASIRYQMEEVLLQSSRDPDTVYIEQIMPKKMNINLLELKRMTLAHSVCIIIKTMGVMI